MHSLSLCEKTHKTIQGKRKERCEASGELRLSLPFIYLPRPPILCRTEPQWQTTNQQHRIRHKSHTGWPISSGLGWVDIVFGCSTLCLVAWADGKSAKMAGQKCMWINPTQVWLRDQLSYPVLHALFTLTDSHICVDSQFSTHVRGGEVLPGCANTTRLW